MKVKVFRVSQVNSDDEEELTTLEIPTIDLPRSGDFIYIDCGDDMYGAIVSHVSWKYVKGKLASIEIIVE
jgi:hypothetical protein